MCDLIPMKNNDKALTWSCNDFTEEGGKQPNREERGRTRYEESDFHQEGKLNPIKARTRLSCATVQAAIDATAHGAGLMRCLSYPLYDYLNRGQLRRVLQPYELPALPVYVVYREGRKASMRVLSFVDFIVKGLREHPAMRPDAL